MKATHKGTCQACGRLQRLPKGRLSQHGYTVAWGYFSGICPGAHQLPLELDRQVLDATMKDLESKAAVLADPETKPAKIVCEPAVVYASSYRRAGANDGRVENTPEAFKALAIESRDHWSYGWYVLPGREDEAQMLERNYQEAVTNAKNLMVRQAASFRHHIDHMTTLADQVHGQPLQPVE